MLCFVCCISYHWPIAIKYIQYRYGIMLLLLIALLLIAPRVLILGHPFIHCLGQFVDHRSHLDRSFMLSGAALFRLGRPHGGHDTG